MPGMIVGEELCRVASGRMTATL